MATFGAVVNDTAPAEPALYGILSPAATVVEDSTSGWQRGFSYETPDCGGTVRLLAICNTADAVTAVPPSGGSLWQSYYPFAVQAEFRCSTMGATPAEIEERAARALESCTQKAVEFELWTGTLAKKSAATYPAQDGEYPNRWLASPDAIDVTPTPGTAVKTKFGLALLERALADCGCGNRGTVHVTRDVGLALGLKDKNDTLLTSLGTKVIAGTGYAGTGPNGTDPSGTQMWMYATGPITVRLGPAEVTPTEQSQAVNTSNNEIVYQTERVAAATWNSCCHHAVLVDLALDYS